MKVVADLNSLSMNALSAWESKKVGRLSRTQFRVVHFFGLMKSRTVKTSLGSIR
jgi:hypothetical protein